MNLAHAAIGKYSNLLDSLSDKSLTAVHTSGHTVSATKWILEGIGKKGEGKWGWVKRFRVIIRPAADQELRSSSSEQRREL